MWMCKYCKKEFIFNRVTEKANHSRWCKDNPERNLNREYVLKNLEKARSFKKNFNNQFSKAKKLGLPIPTGTTKGMKFPNNGRTWSEEQKKEFSRKRIKFLIENPDKHPWKNNSKFVSYPCELFKKKLKERGCVFEEEYNPNIEGRNFSIDVAFINKKIAVEINGNQHYEKDGTLKIYYQKRHDLIESCGWKVIELHYTQAFNDELIKDLIQKYMLA